METQAQKRYRSLVSKKAPKSNLLYDCLKAFWVGGTICLSGEIISVFIESVFALPHADALTWTSVVLIFSGATLTGIGVYDKIGKYAGAGSIVPITGFANGIASPAIEFKTEGYVMGLGAKVFIIAGPVIVYGVSASVLVGIVYYIFSMI